MIYKDKTKEELTQALLKLQLEYDSLKSFYDKDKAEYNKAADTVVNSSDLLNNLACLVPGVIYQYRLYPDGRSAFPYSSPGMNEIYEVTPEEVQEDATPVFGRLHPDDYDHVYNSIQESARTLQIFYCEFRVVLPRKGLAWRWSQAHPERMADGSTLWHGIIVDITERKKSEEILEETIAELKKNQRITHVGNWKLDLLTNTFTASEEGLRLFGFPLGSHPKFQQVTDCIHPEDLGMVLERLEQSLRMRENNSIEFRIFNNETGNLKNILSIGEIQYGSNGEPISVTGTHQDITDLKQAENELREINVSIKREKQEKEAIINSTNDLIWSVDRNFKLITANEAFLNTTKTFLSAIYHNGDDVPDKNLFSSETISYWRDLYEEALNGQTIHKEFYTPATPNSACSWLEINLNPIFLESEIIGVACFGNNITFNKKAESKVKLLNRAIEQNPVTVVITDIDGNIEYVNPKFTEVTGYTIDEVKGKNPRILQSGKHTKEFYTVLWDTILAGKEWSGEFQNKKKNGDTYWESALISSILNSQGEISNFVGVKEDITEKKKMVEDLIIAKEKAEESDKLKTAFLNNISHEIRTPFNGILGFLSMLQNNNLTNIERNEYFSIINTSSNRLMDTINNIVEISQIQAGQMKQTSSDTNINKMSGDLYNRFKVEAEIKGLGLTLNNNLPKNFESVFTDQIKLNTILSNLFDNAIKFTKHGSIEFEIYKMDDYLQFSVKDTGIGIPDFKKRTIFDRFIQVDVSKTRQFEGLGLGLSISKAFAEMLGGKIWVESKEGKGSIFYLSIPLKNAKGLSNGF